MLFELGIVLMALALYDAYVSWRVLTDEASSRRQKFAQLGITWLIPLAGAILVHWVLLAQSRNGDRPSGEYAKYEDYQDYAYTPRIHDDS